MTTIDKKLRAFITETFLFGVDTPFADDDSLLEQGIIDSTGVLELITHLEAEYSITIDDDELIPDNLDSISNLVRFINRKTKNEVSPA